MLGVSSNILIWESTKIRVPFCGVPITSVTRIIRGLYWVPPILDPQQLLNPAARLMISIYSSNAGRSY